MSIFHTIILGIVEGITEFLPISSTAHLEIAQRLLGIMTSDFIKSFEIAIQLGAIMAAVFFYQKSLLSASFMYIRNIIIAFIPTGVIGFILYKLIKSFLLGNIFIAAAMLLLGGLIIIFYEYKAKGRADISLHKTIESLSVKELLTIGSAQALAVVPGVSRSGAVIISGRLLGLPKTLITEFSFLLAIPTMLAATGYDLLKSGFSFSMSEWVNIFIGAIVSFFVALIVIKWFLQYIQTHTFSIFGWYRVILGLALLAIFL
ncbi:MAG TPA: undecaprenyl-diphosphate phosphatase [Candidatus Paceibacterota bacterium]|jgi:undecaprenyl-diphosphatase|nr:undecaprenyl-diphosphate phosphatase [Candidatus Paceibacterota bacterium]